MKFWFTQDNRDLLNAEHIIAHERFQTDIAGFGYQHGAKAGGEISNSGLALAYMGEFRREFCPCGDLKQDFR
jgi:hypothetical protein